MIAQNPNKSISYTLSLGNGLNWSLESDDNLNDWMEDYAKILGLDKKELPNSAQYFIQYHSTENSNPNFPEKIHNLPKSYERNPYCFWSDPAQEKVVCRFREKSGPLIPYINMYRSLSPIFDRAVQNGGLNLHSAMAEWNGNGILILATGDTGKSTCIRRLPSHWKGRCDDQVLVLKNSSGKFAGHPFPTWSEFLTESMDKPKKTWDVQKATPISAMFFLEQSQKEETLKIGRAETCLRLLKSSQEIHQSIKEKKSQDFKKLTSKLFSNACQFANEIPAYRLKASLNGRFWEKIEDVL